MLITKYLLLVFFNLFSIEEMSTINTIYFQNKLFYLQI